MKYVLGVGALIILAVGAFWFATEDRDFDEMQDMMSGVLTEGIDLTKLKDINVAEVKPTEIVELKDGDTFDLVASIVKQAVGNRIIKRLAYNGQIPGPVLKVQKGAKVTINFTNNIDMETSLHSHGIRGDYLMDGAVPITPAIPIGGTFSYVLEFPDTGVYWYHPHVREDYQQELGLYGNFIVEEDGYWNDVAKEEYLILDDILEGGDFDSKVVTNTLMGRFGNTLLINDKEDYTLTVKQGEITRLFLTNVANTRTFDVAFDGAKTKVVGGDNGRIEHEKLVDDVIIGTSERYIVEVLYNDAGTYDIEHRGKKIGTVVVETGDRDESEAFATLRDNGADYSALRADMNALLAKAPDKKLRLDVELEGRVGEMMEHNSVSEDGKITLMGVEMTREGAVEHCKGMPGMMGCESILNQAKEEMGNMIGGESEHSADGIEWEDDMAMMNNMSTDNTVKWIIEDQDTKKQNEDIDWTFNQGDLVKVRIFNDDDGIHPMQHPIHFHGQRFVVLATDGVQNGNLQWKDTTLIPTGRTVDVLVDMSNQGKWMAHCHIAEHLHAGMMFTFDVE